MVVRRLVSRLVWLKVLSFSSFNTQVTGRIFAYFCTAYALCENA